MPCRPLFITWDGPQVSYLEGLFVPIFKALAKHGYQFHVLQFTWPGADANASAQAACTAAGVPYRAVQVWRRPAGLGALVTALNGAGHIRRCVRDWRIDVLMPRSLMPALATLALRGRSGLPVLFDADGFAADERVDFGGLSASSWTYRILRDVEAEMVRQADGVLVRTLSSVNVLVARAGAGTTSHKFTVVSNGRDNELFSAARASRPPRGKDGFEAKDSFRLCYVGSIGEQYCPETMLSVAVKLKDQIPNLSFEVLTGDGQAFLSHKAYAALSDRSWITVRRVPQDQVPGFLTSCDLALAFRKPSFSTQGVAPIKLGEYLMAGVPIVGTFFEGDVETLIKKGVFYAIDGSDIAKLLDWIGSEVISRRDELRDRCQEVGNQLFSIERTKQQYLGVFAKLDDFASAKGAG